MAINPDSEEQVTVDHPDVEPYPRNLMEEGESWGFFRGRSRLEHAATILGGPVIAGVFYLGVLAALGEWHSAVYLQAPETRTLRLIVFTASVGVSTIYYVVATTQAYGHYVLNAYIFPLSAPIAGGYIIAGRFTKIGQWTPPLGGDVGSISSPAFLADTIIAIIPGIIIVKIAHRLIVQWVIDHPEEAKEWERRHMPLALLSYWIEQADDE